MQIQYYEKYKNLGKVASESEAEHSRDANRLEETRGNELHVHALLMLYRTMKNMPSQWNSGIRNSVWHPFLALPLISSK